MIAGVVLEGYKNPLGVGPHGMKIADSNQSADIEANRDIDGFQRCVTSLARPFASLTASDNIDLCSRIRRTGTLGRGVPDDVVTFTSKAQYSVSAARTDTAKNPNPRSAQV